MNLNGVDYRKNEDFVWLSRLFCFSLYRLNEYRIMSYEQLAKLELLDAVKNINTESELNEFKDVIARYFAAKAQREVDSLWDNGTIDEQTVEDWGNEHMRTPYRYASNRS